MPCGWLPVMGCTRVFCFAAAKVWGAGEYVSCSGPAQEGEGKRGVAAARLVLALSQWAWCREPTAIPSWSVRRASSRRPFEGALSRNCNRKSFEFTTHRTHLWRQYVVCSDPYRAPFRVVHGPHRLMGALLQCPQTEALVQAHSVLHKIILPG